MPLIKSLVLFVKLVSYPLRPPLFLPSMFTISTAIGSNMKVRIILSFAICSILAAGCGAVSLTYESLGALNKGMERAKVQETLDIRPRESRTLTIGGRTYIVDVYPLVTAAAKSRGAYGSSVAVDLTNDLYMLYQNDKLRYWGMMGDYSKTEDLQIAEIAPELYNLLIDKK